MASSTAMETLTQMDLENSINSTMVQQLINSLIPIVWVVKVEYETQEKKINLVRTAFCVKKGGILLTCADFLPHRKISYDIVVRRLDKDEFLKANIVFHKPKWDMLLLKVENVDDIDCPCGELATDGSQSEGQTVIHMGNPGSLFGTVLEGKVAFPCINSVTLPKGDKMCKSYKSSMKITPEHRMTGHIWNEHRTPEYRMTGQIWNEDAFKDTKPDEFTFFKAVHAHIPLIQICGFNCCGSQGGPVVNLKGEIVGMVIAIEKKYYFASHVTILREFLRLFEENYKREDCSDSISQGRPSKKKKGRTFQ